MKMTRLLGATGFTLSLMLLHLRPQPISTGIPGMPVNSTRAADTECQRKSRRAGNKRGRAMFRGCAGIRCAVVRCPVNPVKPPYGLRPIRPRQQVVSPRLLWRPAAAGGEMEPRVTQ